MKAQLVRIEENDGSITIADMPRDSYAEITRKHDGYTEAVGDVVFKPCCGDMVFNLVRNLWCPASNIKTRVRLLKPGTQLTITD